MLEDKELEKYYKEHVIDIHGGGNDLNHDISLYGTGSEYSEGVHPNNFLGVDLIISEEDKKCFCGGLETLLWSISENFPKAKKFFVKMHEKVGRAWYNDYIN